MSYLLIVDGWGGQVSTYDLPSIEEARTIMDELGDSASYRLFEVVREIQIEDTVRRELRVV